MSTVYLGLGSNLGNRRENINAAINLLTLNQVIIEKVSSIIETDPVGGPPQDKFLNAVLKAHTTISPEQLLETILSIEQKLGRQRTVPNGPRTIDIDILFFDKIRIKTTQLTIPHPEIKNRGFVLDPLKEIEPVLVQEFMK